MSLSFFLIVFERLSHSRQPESTNHGMADTLAVIPVEYKGPAERPTSTKTAFYINDSLAVALTKISMYQTHLLDRFFYFTQLLIEVGLFGQSIVCYHSIFCYNRPHPRIPRI